MTDYVWPTSPNIYLKNPFISKNDPKRIDISLYFHTKKTISASDAIHSWQIHLFLVFLKSILYERQIQV